MNTLAKQIDEIKNTQQWPYNVWSLFTTTFPKINKEHIAEHDAQKYLTILKPLLENSVSYMTTFCAHNRFSENHLKEHKAFVIWLFGQFIGVLLRDKYTSQFDLCVNVQLRILNLLVNKNGTMFASVIRCYISAFKDLTDTSYSLNVSKNDQFVQNAGNGGFNWFLPDELPDSKLIFVNLKYNIPAKKVYIRMISHLLMVLSKNIKAISICCQDACPELWKITIRLMNVSSVEKSAIYNFISVFIDFCGLPECHKMRYSLLRCIKEQIQLFCTYGKVDHEKDFESMIGVISGRITPYYSYSNLFSSLTVSSVSIYLNLTSAPVILNFLETILSTASLDDSLYESESNFDLSDLCLYGKIVERLIMKDVRNARKQSNAKCLKVFDVSLTWKNILSKMDALVTTASDADDDIWKIFSPVYLVSNIASSVSHALRKDGHACSFFDQEVYPLIDTITKLAVNARVKERRNLKIFLEIVGNLVTLPEFGFGSADDSNCDGDNNNRSTEVAIIILSIPWVSSFNIPYNYAGAKDMIFPLCKMYKSTIDLSIQKLCLLYLARMQNSMYCGLRDDYIVKKLINQYELILPILHVVVCNMSLPNIEFLLQHVMAESDETVHIEFCKSLKLLICSLSKRCYFTRSLINVWDLSCVLCDDANGGDDDDVGRRLDGRNDDSSSNILESGLSRRIEAQFSQYFVKIMNSSMTEAKRHILVNVRFLFNHLQMEEFSEFLDVCKTCVHSEDATLRSCFVDSVPYLLFPRRMLIARCLSRGRRRNNKATNVVYFLEKDLSSNELKNFEAYVVYLLSVVRDSLDSANKDTQYASMTIIYKIGCVPCKITLFPALKILIHFLLTATSCYSSCAKFYIEEVAAAHGHTEESIYVQYRDQLFFLMARILLLNYMLHGASIQKVFYKFDYKSIVNDATHCHLMKFLILLVSKNRRAMPLLDQLAEITNISTNQILIADFKHIYSNAVLFEKTENLETIIEIITERTKLTLCDLLSQCYTNVVVLCLVHYHQYRKQVENIIITMHRLCNRSVVSDMRDCLESKFLGILLLMEHYLTSTNTPPYVKCDMLTSFAKLLRVMGTQYITTIRFKVLAILKTMLTLEDENEIILSIRVWESFIHCIDVDTLGPLLSTIFVSLMPFSQIEDDDSVNEIFQFLIIDNKDKVSNYIQDLYFVEPSQCSKEVYKTIQTLSLSVMEKPIQERLEAISKWLKHDLSEVKLHALKRLQMELSKYRIDIDKLMLPIDTPNRVVLQIVETLVNGFRDFDEKVQEASGECLGEIGAIDSNYIPYAVKKSDHFPLDVESTLFITNGLMVFCRGFQSAKSSFAMDNFALAIQELLLMYNVTVDGDLWKSMSSDLQEIMTPFRYTTYSLPSNDNLGPNYPHPIYFSRHGRTFHSWTHAWLCYLYTLLPNNDKVKTITYWCKGAISSDNDCLLLFLPYIVLQAILNSNEECRMKIHEEMLIILTYSIKHNESVRHNESQSIEQKLKNLNNGELETSVANKVVKANVIFVKTMFSLIEQLRKAMYEIGYKADAFTKLKAFLDKFSSLLLAEKAVECGEYARALFYIEDHIKKTSSVGPHISVLSKIYYHLNDTDDLKGVLSLESNKPKQPQDIVLLHEITDQFHDAAICYQKLLKGADEEYRLSYQRKMLRCYLAINQPEVALSFVNSSASEVDMGLQGIGAEALWSLSQFEKLDEFVNKQRTFECPSSLDSLSNLLNESWGIQLGKSMIQLLNIDKQSVRREICSVRSTISKLLHVSSISFTDYRESYEYFVKLHILSEFEKVAKLVTAAATDDGTMTTGDWLDKFNLVFTTEFEERLVKLQPTSRVLQPVLNMRQVLFTIAQKILSTRKPELNKFFEEKISKCWIKRIEIARQTRNFQLAYSNIMEAENYEFKGFYIERAKYHWDKLEHSEALRILKHGLHYNFPDIHKFKSTPMDENVTDRQLCSKTLLLIGIYNDQMSNVDTQLNSWYFEKAVEVYKCSEKVLVKLANYKDKTLHNSKSDVIYKEQLDDYIATINYYGKSLDYGCEYIHQSMSRMISIWLDFSQRYSSDFQSKTDRAFMDLWKKTVVTMCQLMASFAKRLPPYFFFTAFSQITSRMSCSHECFVVLRMIIVSCIKNYPDQSLWRFTAFLKSPSDVLASKCREILADPELRPLRDIIDKFRNIFAKLSTVCTTLINRPGKYSLSTLTKESRSLMEANYYSMVMVPAQKFLNVTLPLCGESYDRNHNPFPQRMVFIYRFKEEVQVYSSLQRPKRVSLYGTDGAEYSLMCKSEDDLRLDCRFMEFNTIVNTYLKRDVQARDRQLHIRTYSVLPLHTKCGIMEFVPNLLTMRESMKKMYACLGLSVTPAQAKELTDKFLTKKTVEDRRKYFIEKLIPAYPAVLGEWYKRSFPNPGSWYTARSSFMRTLAVMSIVGYIMGLGDRHCDNILLDSSNGDVIHVDFNLVFNAGDNLPTPEVVPFRLTHNMVDAMGPLGVEGMFIYTCEITNRVLRNHKEQLISVLSPFLYDPQKWTDSSHSREEMFRSIRNKINNLELRLNGDVRALRTEQPSMPLSVEGQTRRLIELATDVNNLCCMFVGWAAYM